VPKSFDFSISPFDRLTDKERQKVVNALDVAYFKTDDYLLTRTETPEHLFVLIKGVVQEFRQNDLVNVYSATDFFDPHSLFDSTCKSDFKATEETLAYMLPKNLFLDLAKQNSDFQDFFFESIAEKLKHQNLDAENRSMANVMVARVEQAYLHPPLIVDAHTSVQDAARIMKDRKATSLLTKHQGVLGVISGTDMREAIILNGMPLSTPIRDCATYDLITIQHDDFLYNAQLLMTRHGIRRLVVHKGQDVLGVLELTDLLSYLSNHSHLVSTKVNRAKTLQDLKSACHSIRPLVQSLHDSGVKIPFITQLVTELNRKLYAKIFQFIAPSRVLENSCLIVMGSEGRGEQVLRTDQDNALIVRDGTLCADDVQDIAAQFTATLLDFGYPECPGGMMVRNRAWRKTEKEFCSDIYHWIVMPTAESHLNLAAFVDAAPVAGDFALYETVRTHLHNQLQQNDGFFAHFARPINAFETPLNLFQQFVTDSSREDELDLKKGGIFPIVHGVRALCLQHGVTAINTFERIDALVDKRFIDRKFAEDIADAFEFMLELRLRTRLKYKDTRQDNYIQPKSLHKLERDALKDSFAIVKQFKQLVTHHFRLNAF
jgi:CBS domain-containing protein